MPSDRDDDELRRRLVALGRFLRDTVIDSRRGGLDMAAVAGHTTADIIYEIDRATDDALVGWFEREWTGVRIVSEGFDEPLDVGTAGSIVIIDAIDGTRGLMHDKRAAWVLAAVAPLDGRLADISAAAMIEIPTTRQWASDELSATAGGGVTAERSDVRSGGSQPLVVRPSTATTLEHGWASFARFFPPAKPLIAAFEERVWTDVYGDIAHLPIFDDQYVCTGGQLAELVLGRDRLLGDVRPLAFAQLGLDRSHACHPYDICTALVLTEAGGVLTDPWGDFLDVPLDTTSPVAWVGYANEALAERIGPAVRRAAEVTFPDAR